MSPADDQQATEPEAIRADIEETRAELGETVEALAQKTDVKGRAEDRITGIKQDARAKAGQLKQRATAATPESARNSGGQVVEKARANPLALAGAAAVVLAFLLGRRSARP